MRAIVIKEFGGPEQLVVETLPDPEPKPGHVVIGVKAFGINRAETYMRRGAWSEADKISGIECVGIVKAELVGNSAVLGSLTTLKRNGRLCLAGFVGGLAPLEGFNPLLQMPSGVHPGSASPDGWLSDRRQGRGQGLRAGDSDITYRDLIEGDRGARLRTTVKSLIYRLL